MREDESLAYLSAALGARKKKSIDFEGAIPLIFVVFIIVIALAKVGVIDLSWVPGLGSLLSSNELKILVISNSPSACTGALNPGVPLTCFFRLSPEAKRYNIIVEEYTTPDLWEITKKYDMVFLLKEEITNTFRENLEEYVARGGKLVIVGNGGSQVSLNQTLLTGIKDFPGWYEGRFDALMPAKGERVTVATSTGLSLLRMSGESSEKFFSLVPSMVPGVLLEVYSGNIQFYTLEAQPSTYVLAFKEVGLDQYRPAIIQKDYNIGTVLYLSWDPVYSNSQVMLWSLIRYLRGG